MLHCVTIAQIVISVMAVLNVLGVLTVNGVQYNSEKEY